jgi:hypothetical protein
VEEEKYKDVHEEGRMRFRCLRSWNSSTNLFGQGENLAQNRAYGNGNGSVFWGLFF